MSMSSIREPATFGKRKQPHTIIVSGNGKTRTFTFNPILIPISMCLAFMLMVGYFGATAYLIFRDDLIGASLSRQARMQHQYEDRIAALRSKLDRITSRQLLDQQAIESRVTELMARQASIHQRTGKMSRLLDNARKRGLTNNGVGAKVPVPVVNPVKESKALDETTTGSIDIDKSGFASRLAYFGEQEADSNAANLKRIGEEKFYTAFTNEIFGDVAEAIVLIDNSQRNEVDGLRIAAEVKTAKIRKTLKSIGVPLPRKEETGVGGPFIPLDHSVEFSEHLRALEISLENYDEVTKIAKKMPLANPLPGAEISSRYGSRVDPFHGRIAFHGGVDFRAKRGTPVLAAGKGVVTKAGRNGGYGKVVEIKHPNGMRTRYAHLSRISVQIGQHVKVGEVIGKVGSTGRSTGSHLHYEIRSGKKTRNPVPYMNAGRRLSKLL